MNGIWEDDDALGRYFIDESKKTMENLYRIMMLCAEDPCRSKVVLSYLKSGSAVYCNNVSTTVYVLNALEIADKEEFVRSADAIFGDLIHEAMYDKVLCLLDHFPQFISDHYFNVLFRILKQIHKRKDKEDCCNFIFKSFLMAPGMIRFFSIEILILALTNPFDVRLLVKILEQQDIATTFDLRMLKDVIDLQPALLKSAKIVLQLLEISKKHSLFIDIFRVYFAEKFSTKDLSSSIIQSTFAFDLFEKIPGGACWILRNNLMNGIDSLVLADSIESDSLLNSILFDTILRIDDFKKRKSAYSLWRGNQNIASQLESVLLAEPSGCALGMIPAMWTSLHILRPDLFSFSLHACTEFVLSSDFNKAIKFLNDLSELALNSDNLKTVMTLTIWRFDDNNASAFAVLLNSLYHKAVGDEECKELFWNSFFKINLGKSAHLFKHFQEIPCLSCYHSYAPYISGEVQLDILIRFDQPDIILSLFQNDDFYIMPKFVTTELLSKLFLIFVDRLPELYKICAVLKKKNTRLFQDYFESLHDNPQELTKFMKFVEIYFKASRNGLMELANVSNIPQMKALKPFLMLINNKTSLEKVLDYELVINPYEMKDLQELTKLHARFAKSLNLRSLNSTMFFVVVLHFNDDAKASNLLCKLARGHVGSDDLVQFAMGLHKSCFGNMQIFHTFLENVISRKPNLKITCNNFDSTAFSSSNFGEFLIEYAKFYFKTYSCPLNISDYLERSLIFGVIEWIPSYYHDCNDEILCNSIKLAILGCTDENKLILLLDKFEQLLAGFQERLLIKCIHMNFTKAVKTLSIYASTSMLVRFLADPFIKEEMKEILLERLQPCKNWMTLMNFDDINSLLLSFIDKNISHLPYNQFVDFSINFNLLKLENLIVKHLLLKQEHYLIPLLTQFSSLNDSFIIRAALQRNLIIPKELIVAPNGNYSAIIFSELPSVKLPSAQSDLLCRMQMTGNFLRGSLNADLKITTLDNLISLFRRDNLYAIHYTNININASSVDKMSNSTAKYLRKKTYLNFLIFPIRVKYTNSFSASVDENGVTREWLSKVSSAMCNDLFIESQSAEKYLIPNCEKSDGAFITMGKLMAIALITKNQVHVPFAPFVFRFIIEATFSWSDVKEIDPILVKTIADKSIVAEEGLEAEFVLFFIGKKLQLLEGKYEFITHDNLKEYKSAVLKTLANFIVPKLQSLRDGFISILPVVMTRIFDAADLSKFLNGLNVIDVADLKANTLYEGYQEDSEQIIWFWEIVEGFNGDQRIELLRFFHGSPQVPQGGFANLQGSDQKAKFQICRSSDVDRLPIASTCFNTLVLPAYESLEILRQRLLLAFTANQCNLTEV